MVRFGLGLEMGLVWDVGKSSSCADCTAKIAARLVPYYARKRSSQVKRSANRSIIQSFFRSFTSNSSLKLLFSSDNASRMVSFLIV